MNVEKKESVKHTFPPLLAIGIAILAVSTASLFIRFAQEDVPSLVIAAWRLLLATLFLAPFVLFTGQDEIKRLARKEWVWMALAGFFLALHFASWITSLEYTSVASSVVLVTTAPLWVAFFTRLVLRKRIGRSVAIGLVVAMIGGIIVGLSKMCLLEQGSLICTFNSEFFSGRALFGNLLALLGAFFSASYLIIGSRVRAKLSLSVYTFLVYGSAALFLVIGCFVAGFSLVGYSTINFGWFFALALVPQLLGHSTFNWALRYLPATYVSISLLGEPVGTIILAYLFLREMPTTLEMFGAVFILVGIFAASLSGINKEIEPGG